MARQSTNIFQSILLVCCIVFCISCKNKSISSEEGKINIKNCEQLAGIKYDDQRFIKNYSVVKLETNDESLIGEIGQVQLFEDRIYVLDEKISNLLVFNTDGSFSHKIGIKGRGPKEYLAINAFYINPNRKEITLFDPLGLKCLVFNLKGEFIAVKDISPKIFPQSITNVRYMCDDQLVCYANPNGISENVLFVLNEEDMSIVDVLASRPMKLSQSIYGMAVQPFSIVDDKLHYVKWFDNNIYEYRKGAVESLMEIDVNKPLVPAKVLANKAENNSGNFIATVIELINDGEYAVGLQNIYETSRFIFCEFKCERYSPSLFIWDKKEMKGAYAAQPSTAVPGLDKIIYSSGNKIFSLWTADDIENFQKQMKEGGFEEGPIAEDIRTALEIHDVSMDNPVLFIYEINE